MIVNDIPILQDMPYEVRVTALRILLAILALLFIWALRNFLTWIVITPLRRYTNRTGREGDDFLVSIVVSSTRFFIFAIAITVSAEILDVRGSLDRFVSNFSRSLLILGILVLIYRLIDLLAPSSNRLFRITGMTIEERLLPFVRTGLKVLVIAIGIVIILQEWNYDVSGLIAGIGLGGLAFSLAAQDTVSNLFGFAAIVGDRPFVVGEYIKTPDVEGVVEHVGMRATRVRQLDQAVVYVPNNTLANSPVLNWSRLRKRRVNYVLGVTYGSTSGQLRVLLHRIREMLKAQEHVEPDTVTVLFVEFGDSSLDILVRCYVYLADWGEFMAEQERLHLEVMDIVEDLGMSVAFPSSSIYIENIQDIMTVDVPTEQPSPTFSPHERALMRGQHTGSLPSEGEPARKHGDVDHEGDDQQALGDEDNR
jgi:MscS family membrane protein